MTEHIIAPKILPMTDEQGEKLRALCGLTHVPIKYQITWQDLSLANEAAIRYQLDHGERGTNHIQGRDKDYWADIANVSRALAAEVACASYLNVYWSGSHGVGSFDVGGRIEIKATHNKFTDRLIIPKNKVHPDAIVARVHMNPKNPTVVLLCGYCLARDFMLEHFWETWRDGGGAYYCPNELLRPIEELDKLFRENGVTCFDHINDKQSINLKQKLL